MKRTAVMVLSLLLSSSVATVHAKTVEQRWNEDMQRARALLLEGDWKAGRKVADKVVTSMAELVSGGTSAAKTMALAITLQAVGEAGTGDLDAASWHWQVARGLAPEVVNDDLLAPFGAPTAVLAGQPTRAVGRLEDGSSPLRQGPAYVHPKLDSLFGLRAPHKIAHVWDGHAVEVEMVIDERGKARAPRVLKSSLPSKTYLLLERARTSTFVAGTVEGRPVTTLARYSQSGTSGPAPATTANLISKVRSLLARGDATTARCLYRGLQGLDASIKAPDVEAAVQALEAREREASLADGAVPVQVGGEVMAPRKLSTPAPMYTERARRAKDQGTVILLTVIDRNGNARQPKILKSVVPDLDLQAIVAVCQWQFEPATMAGQPVDVYYNLTINFRLQGKSKKKKR